MKKALSLLGESEEDNELLVSVRADELRALIAAYELVAEQWLQIIADYEFLEHQYADVTSAVHSYIDVIERIERLTGQMVAREGQVKQLESARQIRVHAGERLDATLGVEIVKLHEAETVILAQ